ncbi:hypothetical protein HK405_011681, partial [Cladochytrium tenue]
PWIELNFTTVHIWVQEEKDIIKEFRNVAKEQSHDQLESSRQILKQIKVAEENLLTIRKKERDVRSRLESAEKRGKETDALKVELDIIEKEVIVKSAFHEGFKREKIKSALKARWNAYIEFSAKLSVIANYGNHLADQIPQGALPPGHALPPFMGGPVTAQIMRDYDVAAQNWASIVPWPNFTPSRALAPQPSSARMSQSSLTAPNMDRLSGSFGSYPEDHAAAPLSPQLELSNANLPMSSPPASPAAAIPLAIPHVVEPQQPAGQYAGPPPILGQYAGPAPVLGQYAGPAPVLGQYAGPAPAMYSAASYQDPSPYNAAPVDPAVPTTVTSFPANAAPVPVDAQPVALSMGYAAPQNPSGEMPSSDAGRLPRPATATGQPGNESSAASASKGVTMGTSVSENVSNMLQTKSGPTPTLMAGATGPPPTAAVAPEKPPSSSALPAGASAAGAGIVGLKDAGAVPVAPPPQTYEAITTAMRKTMGGLGVFVACFDWASTQADELSFTVGDAIIASASGFFPFNAVVPALNGFGEPARPAPGQPSADSLYLAGSLDAQTYRRVVDAVCGLQGLPPPPPGAPLPSRAVPLSPPFAASLAAP